MSLKAPLLLTGGSGLIGTAIYNESLSGYRTTIAVNRTRPRTLRRGDRLVNARLEVPGVARRLVELVEPEVIVHLAAMSSLGECEQSPDRATQINVNATAELAQAAAETGAYIVSFSTDQVFDGTAAPYRETDLPAPMGRYAETKVEGEQALLNVAVDGLVVRCALVLGLAPDQKSGALDMLRPSPQAATLFEDEWRTPIATGCLARVMAALLRERPSGILHLGGVERIDRLNLGREIVAAFGWQRELQAGSRMSMSYPRPEDLSLDLSRLRELKLPEPEPLKLALARLARSLGAK